MWDLSRLMDLVLDSTLSMIRSIPLPSCISMDNTLNWGEETYETILDRGFSFFLRMIVWLKITFH